MHSVCDLPAVKRSRSGLIQLFLLPNSFFDAPVFLPGLFLEPVPIIVFFAAGFFGSPFVLSFLDGCFFTGAFFADTCFREVSWCVKFLGGAFFVVAFFAGALRRGLGLTATVSGAVRKSTAALVKFASSSIFEICDASSVMNLAPSMEFATKAPIPGGVDRSCRPAITRTLFPMLRMASR